MRYLMSTTTTSDEPLLDLLRLRGALTVTQLGEALQVTATAVRQRLNRLMAEGLVEREIERGARGRPSHRYALTDKGRCEAGNNFADLAAVLWQEVRAVSDPEVRRGLLSRIAQHLSGRYRNHVQGHTREQKLASLAEYFQKQGIPTHVEQKEGLPVLTMLACPYPGLAEQDRGICAMERMLFRDLLQDDLALTNCRLDGESCCTFETK